MTSAKKLRPISFYLLCIVWQSSKMGNIFLRNWSRLFPLQSLLLYLLTSFSHYLTRSRVISSLYHKSWKYAAACRWCKRGGNSGKDFKFKPSLVIWGPHFPHFIDADCRLPIMQSNYSISPFWGFSSLWLRPSGLFWFWWPFEVFSNIFCNKIS